MIEDLFVPDTVYEADGWQIIKNRELVEGKTTFRCIDISYNGSDPNHPLIQLLFDKYEGSCLKVVQDFNDFRDCLLSGVRVTLVPELKGDQFFQDRFDRVVRFVQKHVPVKEKAMVAA